VIPEETEGKGGITSFPRLYITSNVLSQKTELIKIKDPNDIKCVCEENDATTFCSDCQEFYCEGCERGHKKGKATKSHSFFSVDDGWKMVSGGASGDSSQQRSAHCLVHPHLQIDSYCNIDQEPICSKCAVEFHSGHTFTKLENLLINFKDEITPQLNQVSFFSFFPSFHFPFPFPSLQFNPTTKTTPI